MSDHKPTNQDDVLLAQSVEFGAMEDKLDVAALWKWTLLTLTFVLILIATSSQLYKYYSYTIAEEQAINAKYDGLTNYLESVHTQLNTSGVLNNEKMIYHIPIDKAINLTVDSYKSK